MAASQLVRVLCPSPLHCYRHWGATSSAQTVETSQQTNVAFVRLALLAHFLLTLVMAVEITRFQVFDVRS